MTGRKRTDEIILVLAARGAIHSTLSGPFLALVQLMLNVEEGDSMNTVHTSVKRTVDSIFSEYLRDH